MGIVARSTHYGEPPEAGPGSNPPLSEFTHHGRVRRSLGTSTVAEATVVLPQPSVTE